MGERQDRPLNLPPSSCPPKKANQTDNSKPTENEHLLTNLLAARRPPTLTSRVPDGMVRLAAALRGLRTGLILAMLGLLWGGASAALADESPVGCTGSALGINLFTSTRDVHIGDTITYSVTIFNGLPGSPRVACDATGIQASLMTPDGVSHDLTSLLVRRTLLNQQNDFYPDIVSYVVRAQDILPDGTVRATASDTGVIHQNDTDSKGAATKA